MAHGLAAQRDFALPAYAERFGTSRGTMRKALASLAQEDWIEIVHGRGNTVTNYCKIENYYAMIDETRKWNAEHFS